MDIKIGSQFKHARTGRTITVTNVEVYVDETSKNSITDALITYVWDENGKESQRPASWMDADFILVTS